MKVTPSWKIHCVASKEEFMNCFYVMRNTLVQVHCFRFISFCLAAFEKSRWSRFRSLTNKPEVDICQETLSDLCGGNLFEEPDSNWAHALLGETIYWNMIVIITACQCIRVKDDYSSRRFSRNVLVGGCKPKKKCLQSCCSNRKANMLQYKQPWKVSI